MRELLETKIPDTIIKVIANYTKGRKAYTTYINHTSSHRQSKLAFHKVASFHQHYSTFTLQTYHHRFRHDITITSTHTSPSTAKKYIQPYLHKVFVWTTQNNLRINPDKTTWTLFTTDPAEYKGNLYLKINNTALPWQHSQRFWALP